jgi:hypothetical protein
VKDSPEPIWNFFVQSIRENLHVVLCMSPAGKLLRVRCRKFPSLVTCCTHDWFFSWPKEALLEVASKFFGENPVNAEGSASGPGRNVHGHLNLGLRPLRALHREQSARSTPPPRFAYALVWSCGCTGDLATRARFEPYLKYLVSSSKISLPFPEKGTVLFSNF